jgi:hypothetical protein
MWESITSWFGANDALFPFQSGSILEVTLDDCIQKFDERLFPLVWCELREVLTLLNKVAESQQLFWELSNVCRHHGVNLSVSQSNRVQKLCEMIESIPELPYPIAFPNDFMDATSGKASLPPATGSSPILLQCPDIDLLNAFIAKFRSKLKLTEDMAASKKSENIRFKYQYPVVESTDHTKRLFLKQKLAINEIFDCNFVRNETKQCLITLEQLETAIQQAHVIFQYLQSFKRRLYRPFIDLQALFTQLPSLVEAKSIVVQAKADFESAELAYQEFRVHDVHLATVTRLKSQLEIICRDIELFVPIYMEQVGFCLISSPDTSTSELLVEEEVRQILSFVSKIFTRSAENTQTTNTPSTQSTVVSDVTSKLCNGQLERNLNTNHPISIISDEDRDILRLLFLEPLLVHLQTMRKSSQPAQNSNTQISAVVSKLTPETLAAIFMKRTVAELETLFLHFHKLFVEMSVQQAPLFLHKSPPQQFQKTNSLASFSPALNDRKHNNNSSSSSSAGISTIQNSTAWVELLEKWTERIPWDELLQLHARLRGTQDLLSMRYLNLNFVCQYFILFFHF